MSGTHIPLLGFVDATAAVYHNDDIGDQPTLSKSIIQILLTASPAHARHAHPKLNPNFERKHEEKFDLGTAAHDVFLEGIDRVVIPADSWRTTAAKEARDEARANGLIPLLPAQAEQVQDMVVALRAQLSQFEEQPPLFTDGKPEQTIVWEDRGVLCRARLDWLRDDLTAVDDLKTTSRLANPEGWCRSTLWSIGADLQQAFYLRGIKAVLGVEPTFRFVLVETDPPHFLSVASVDPMSLAVSNRKIDHALDLWRRCLESDEWPAYDRRVHYAEMPAWEESRWLEREMREFAA